MSSFHHSFLFRHSQKIVSAGFIGSSAIVFLVQPYIEVLTRWCQIKVHNNIEYRPSKYLTELTNQAYAKLNLTENVTKQVDVFLTESGESIALGRLSSNSTHDYAFIGLPFFCNYSSADEIPLSDAHFSTTLFPHTTHSAIGQQRLDLMILPEKAIQFLISRELVSLLGSSRFCALSKSAKQSIGLFPAQRTVSQISSIAFLSALYLSYQTCYFLNRLFRMHTTWMLPVRLASYLVISGSIMLCQRQLLDTYRRKICFSIDQLIGEVCPDLRAGGIIYYTWRLNWNAFWAKRLPECQKIISTLQTVASGVQESDFSPQLKYQLQMSLLNPTYLHKSSKDYYYIPPSIYASSRDHLSINNVNLASIYNQIPSYSPYTLTGNEKFTSDGTSIYLNLSGSLVSGVLPRLIARFFELLCNPATSSQRRMTLEKDLLADSLL